jgi:hypothetical protein
LNIDVRIGNVVFLRLAHRNRMYCRIFVGQNLGKKSKFWLVLVGILSGNGEFLIKLGIFSYKIGRKWRVLVGFS